MTMPASDFNVPRGSFPTPIEPIGVGPLMEPLVEVRFNYKWCSVIVGALSQLLLNTTWDVSTQAALTAIQEDVFDLMSAFCVNPPPARFTPNTGVDGGDEFMLRQNPDNPCELQTSVDGITWCTWADLSKCVPEVGQQAGGSPQPAPGGGCTNYHVILPANGKYLLPAPVNPGDTLLISNLTGASNDGTLSPWYCGDGNLYFAGGCFGSPTHQSGDPLPANNHLSLIAEAGGLFFGVLGGSISIGAVGAFQNLTFQVNDSILSDNAGSLEFDVTMCNEQASAWTHTLDFVTDPRGFAPFAANEGTWIAGSGWNSDFSGGTTDEVYIQRVLPVVVGGAYNTLDFFYTSSYAGDGYATNGVVTDHFTLIVGSDHHLFSAGFSAGQTFGVECLRSLGALACCEFQITKIVITGTGTDPF